MPDQGAEFSVFNALQMLPEGLCEDSAPALLIVGGAPQGLNHARHLERWLRCAPHPRRGRALDPPPAG